MISVLVPNRHIRRSKTSPHPHSHHRFANESKINKNKQNKTKQKQNLNTNANPKVRKTDWACFKNFQLQATLNASANSGERTGIRDDVGRNTYTGWLKPQWKSNPTTAWAQSIPSFFATRWMPLTKKLSKETASERTFIRKRGSQDLWNIERVLSREEWRTMICRTASRNYHFLKWLHM